MATPSGNRRSGVGDRLQNHAAVGVQKDHSERAASIGVERSATTRGAVASFVDPAAGISLRQSRSWTISRSEMRLGESFMKELLRVGASVQQNVKDAFHIGGSGATPSHQ
jgi:hypothetical protein